MEILRSAISKIQKLDLFNMTPAFALAGGLGINKPSDLDANAMLFAGKPQGSGGSKNLSFPCAIDENNLKTLLMTNNVFEGKFVFHVKRNILGVDNTDKKKHVEVAAKSMPGLDVMDKDVPDIVGGLIMFDNYHKKSYTLQFVITSGHFNSNKSLVELRKYMDDILRKNDLSIKSSEIAGNILNFDLKV
jgi:hypothetical protein